MVSYDYLISVDFTNGLQTNTLHDTIENDQNIVPNLLSIDTDNNNVHILFDTNLSTGEQTTLDGIVSSHVPIPIDKSLMYSSIVDSRGYGDYLKLSDAIAAGKKTIFIRSGVYVETLDIHLPDNFFITGEDKSSTVINFLNTNSGIVINGSGNMETTGTISITYNTSTVTGNGTTFTNLKVGDYIMIGQGYHQIISIESDISLTLKSIYNGITLNGVNYKAGEFKTGSLSNILLLMSSGNLITINRGMNLSLNNIGLGLGVKGICIDNSTQYTLNTLVIFNCTDGLDINNSSLFTVTNSIIINNSQDGLILNNGIECSLENAYMFNSGIYGMKIIDGNDIQISNCMANYNNDSGLHISTNKNVTISTCVFSYNGNNGIECIGSGYCLINGTLCNKNSNNGIVTSENDVLVNNIIDGNTNNGIEIYDNCSVNSCIINNNLGDGIKIISADESIICTNHIKYNGGTGVNIDGTDNIISLNIVKGNTTAQITDNGTTTTLANNKT